MRMEFDQATLCRDLGMPVDSGESRIRARIKGVGVWQELVASGQVPGSRVTASRPKPAPAKRVDSALIAAATDVELHSLRGSVVTDAERQAVDAEVQHRAFMARSFPAALKSGHTSPRARIHHCD